MDAERGAVTTRISSGIGTVEGINTDWFFERTRKMDLLWQQARGQRSRSQL